LRQVVDIRCHGACHVVVVRVVEARGDRFVGVKTTWNWSVIDMSERNVDFESVKSNATGNAINCGVIDVWFYAKCLWGYKKIKLYKTEMVKTNENSQQI
jgi:hypothetical protein